jgi:hypothetical protein
LADLDGDGKAELVSGGYDGRVYRWPLLSDGSFGACEVVLAPKSPEFKDAHVACHAADWDGDGKLDLVLGARHGEVLLARNEGSGFAVPVLLVKAPAGDAGPHAADWDGDGDLDLLVGDDRGRVTLYRNSGTRTAPKLSAGETLVPDRGGRFVEERCRKSEECAMRAKPWVVDWNGDGRPDLLVGDFHDHREPGRNGNEHMHGWIWLYARR